MKAFEKSFSGAAVINTPYKVILRVAERRY